MSTENGLWAWPEDWPWYKQMCFGSWDDRCDMLVGPCACGAWHQEGEFEWDEKRQVLYRYGEVVPHFFPLSGNSPERVEHVEPADRPLCARIYGQLLVIEVGLNTLATVAETRSGNAMVYELVVENNEPLVVADKRELAKAVIKELLEEHEYGQNLLEEMFDYCLARVRNEQRAT